MKLTVKNNGSPPGKTPLCALLGTSDKKLEPPKGVKLAKSALEDFKGDFRQCRLSDAADGPAERVLLIGLGKARELDLERVRRAGAMVAKRAEGAGCASAALWCTAELEEAVGGAEAAGRALAEGLIMGSYSFQRCKSKPKAAKLKTVTVYGSGAAFKRGVDQGTVLAEANCFARDLQNAPANWMRPRDLVAEARKLARRSERITCRVLDEKAMGTMKMGSLLSVAAGTTEPAFLIHMTYKPKGNVRGKIAFVGKGLTFDAGGISLKPSAKMDEMKYDMSGSAAVLGTMHALAGIDVPYEVHVIVGAVENMPDGGATKPGDVVTAMNGTTIEILNTDAEGRLVLADALAYTISKVKPDTVIDLATLTGAVVVALGHELSGMFATTDALRDELLAAGREVGEAVWPLPLLDCHKDQMKSKVADLRNINSGEGNGSTAGAAFLAGFVGDTEWCHLDIAGTAWGGIDRDYVGGPQGSGVGVRLLMRYLENKH